MSGSRALVLYARVPRAGAVKTRMIPWLDAREALALHRALLEDSLRLLRRAASLAGARPILSFSEAWEPGSDGESRPLAEACAGIDLAPQRGGDLGERLARTFADMRGQGCRGAAVIGSDSPTLPPERIAEAFARLEGGAEVVLGPAEDGGYYLVAAAREMPQMFAALPWGTAEVLAATLDRLARAGVRPFLLPPWYDLDTPADLARARSDLAARTDGAAPRTAAFLARLERLGRLPGAAQRSGP